MKKVRLQNNMRIIGIRNFRGGAKRIDYFLITPGNEKLYAFSCTYTHKSYDMCKSGIMVNQLKDLLSRLTSSSMERNIRMSLLTSRFQI